MQAPRSGNPAVRQGLIVGVALGIILVIISLITNLVNLGTVGSILAFIFFVVALVAFGYAGFRAAAITGKTGSGAIAGLIAGVIAYLMSALVSIILAFTITDTLRQRSLAAVGTSQQARDLITNQFVIGTAVGGAFLSILIGLAIGAAAGAIGGVIGKGRAPQQQHQEAMYQGMPPAAGTPGAPQDPYQGQTPPPNYQ